MAMHAPISQAKSRLRRSPGGGTAGVDCTLFWLNACVPRAVCSPRACWRALALLKVVQGGKGAAPRRTLGRLAALQRLQVALARCWEERASSELRWVPAFLHGPPDRACVWGQRHFVPAVR